MFYRRIMFAGNMVRSLKGRFFSMCTIYVFQTVMKSAANSGAKLVQLVKAGQGRLRRTHEARERVARCDRDRSGRLLASRGAFGLWVEIVLNRVKSFKTILIQARTTFSTSINVGLSRKLDLRISLHPDAGVAQHYERERTHKTCSLKTILASLSVSESGGWAGSKVSLFRGRQS